MGERRTPKRARAKMIRATAAIIVVAGAAALAAAPESLAQFPSDATPSPEVSAPSRSQPARARTRIRVTPAYPYRPYATTYPVPYTYEYPGPGHVRECTSWLAPENRPPRPTPFPQIHCLARP